MTYSISWNVADSRSLVMEDCKKSDTLQAGMLEQVLPDTICWHDIEEKDIERVLNYIRFEFGHINIWIESEYYDGCVCDLTFVCGTIA